MFFYIRSPLMLFTFYRKNIFISVLRIKPKVTPTKTAFLWGFNRTDFSIVKVLSGKLRVESSVTSFVEITSNEVTLAWKRFNEINYNDDIWDLKTLWPYFEHVLAISPWGHFNGSFSNLKHLCNLAASDWTSCGSVSALEH